MPASATSAIVGGMRQSIRVVGSRPAGRLAGVLCCAVAGTFVWTAWVNDLLLGFAVAGIVAGLVVCVLWGAPGWQRFGVGLLVGAVVAVVAWSAVSYLIGSSTSVTRSQCAVGSTRARSSPWSCP